MIPTPESWYKAPGAVAAGSVYAVGYLGDVDPGVVLEDCIFYNAASHGVYIGSSLTGVLDSAYVAVKAGATYELKGPREGFILYNPHASDSATTSFSATGWQRNSGRDGGVKPRKDAPSGSTRYYLVRPTKTAGETKYTEIAIKGRCTVASVKLYSVSVPSGATITLDLIDAKGRSLLSAPYNLESLTTKTLAAATLTTSTGLLDIAPGSTLRLKYVSSDAGDTLGDTLVEIAITES